MRTKAYCSSGRKSAALTVVALRERRNVCEGNSKEACNDSVTHVLWGVSGIGSRRIVSGTLT